MLGDGRAQLFAFAPEAQKVMQSRGGGRDSGDDHQSRYWVAHQHADADDKVDHDGNAEPPPDAISIFYHGISMPLADCGG